MFAVRFLVLFRVLRGNLKFLSHDIARAEHGKSFKTFQLDASECREPDAGSGRTRPDSSDSE